VEVKFPEGREENRRALLDAVSNIRGILAADANESEALRTLPPASVQALTDSGLFALKCPRELGGAEADPVTQIEVIEAVSYIDAAAGWCLSISSGTLSVIAARLPQRGIDQLFAGGRPPRCAGALSPGTAVRTDGGYRVTGRWPWASGVRHAEWVLSLGIVQSAQERPHPWMFVVPADQVQIHDTWNVVGLKGTGSCDFSLNDHFVPEALSFDAHEWEPLRGGALYHLGLPGLVVNELAGVALGVGRRALDEIVALAKGKRRGYGKQTLMADRGAFQRALGLSDMRLRAARAHVLDIYERAWQTVSSGGRPDAETQVEMRSAATFAMDVALEVATSAFHYGGGAAIQLGSALQRCLRDIQAGSAHLLASDIVYELRGQCMLGMPNVDPMG